MKNLLIILVGLMGINASASYPDLPTVEHVDLTRYAGEWNQIAFFPTRFQGSCTINTKAHYSLNDNGTVKVMNECEKPNGTYKSITGVARVVDAVTNAKLKVKFFWFAPAGDYWVIDLGENYEYAVVGEPSRKYLWILARDSAMKKATYDAILNKVSNLGFDISRLQITGQVID